MTIADLYPTTSVIQAGWESLSQNIKQKLHYVSLALTGSWTLNQPLSPDEDKALIVLRLSLMLLSWAEGGVLLKD